MILRIGERRLVAAFELDAERKIITRTAALPARLARMPGAIADVDELGQRALSIDQKMGRYGQFVDLEKIFVRRG